MGNKSARQLLEMIYGKGCMFKRANIPERLEGYKIRGYKVFVAGQKFKSKKIKKLEETMTYHHLIHRSEGGETTIENGAILSELAHIYIHSLPREQEEIINNMLREYKQKISIRGGILIPADNDLEIQQPFQIELGIDREADDCLIIPAYDNTREDIEKRFNRAKIKRDTLKQIEEALYDEDLKF